MARLLKKCWMICILCTIFVQASSGDELQDIIEITDQLSKLARPITPENLFSVSSQKTLKLVTKLPNVGEWLKKKVNTSYKVQDVEMFKLAEKVARVSRVCAVACEGFSCKREVTNFQSYYQDLAQALKSASYNFFLLGLRSVEVQRRALGRVKNNQSWNVAKQMNKIVATHDRKRKKLRRKIAPMLDEISQSIDKLPDLIKTNKKEVTAEMKKLNSKIKSTKDEITSLEATSKNLKQDLDDIEVRVPQLEKDQQNKIKEKEDLENKILKQDECFSELEAKRADGPFFWITTHKTEGKYTLTANTFSSSSEYSADVSETEAVKTSDYAQMYLEKQKNGKYKIFNKYLKGVLYCSRNDNDDRVPFATFSKDPAFEDEGRELWELQTSGNPVFTIYNEKCANNLCVNIEKGETGGKAVVSECAGDNGNYEWRLLDKMPGSEVVEDDSDDSGDDLIDGDATTAAPKLTKRESKKCLIKTKKGKCCAFPFTYANVKYTDACPIRPRDGLVWCYTDKKKKGWDACVGKKLQKVVLPDDVPKLCGKKIDGSKVGKLSVAINSIAMQIRDSNSMKQTKALELRINDIKIGPQKKYLGQLEGRLPSMKAGESRMSTGIEAAETLSKGWCEVKAYAKSWNDFKIGYKSSDSTAITPAPAKRDLVIRCGYNLLAYALGTLNTWKGFSYVRKAADDVFVARPPRDKDAFFQKATETLQETDTALENYSSKRC